MYDSVLRPIEMGRRLLGLVDAQVADDTRSIPHAYTVVLHPKDRAAFADVEHELVRELAEAVTQHSQREAYRLAEPVLVVLQESVDVRIGSMNVLPALAATAVTHAPATLAPSGDESESTNRSDADESVVIKPVTTSLSGTLPGAITAALVLDDGTRHVLETERVVVGRQSGCSIVIRDTNVSREHLQLRRRPSGWTIRDLGSTNGTKLNGVRVEGEQMLANGDVIMLGAIRVLFEIS